MVAQPKDDKYPVSKGDSGEVLPIQADRSGAVQPPAKTRNCPDGVYPWERNARLGMLLPLDACAGWLAALVALPLDRRGLEVAFLQLTILWVVSEQGIIYLSIEEIFSGEKIACGAAMPVNLPRLLSLDPYPKKAWSRCDDQWRPGAHRR